DLQNRDRPPKEGQTSKRGTDLQKRDRPPKEGQTSKRGTDLQKRDRPPFFMVNKKGRSEFLGNLKKEF
ncbi:MAG: hypothetical protein MR739_06600, partial [Spirochaetia bacterium]|nr:hypothetical protein [Spirochaetia bacterium]